MKQLVLYCKSYINDIDRLQKLVESINEFNLDNIPLFISVPKSDINLFKHRFIEHNVICDDEVYNGKLSGWESQQIIKSCFYKTNISENYVCLDSDSFFVKPFRVNDFMMGLCPYTVMHEQKELFTWVSLNKGLLGFDPKKSFIKDRNKIMDIFSRRGKVYDFGPSPVIWSSKVWNDLEEQYIVPHKLTWDTLIKFCPSEFTWYGEALLQYKSIQLFPAEPLFKVFHYKQQLDQYKDIPHSIIAENYLGIVVQSNFT